MSDLIFHNHGSIVLLFAQTDAGTEWVDEHISDEAMSFAGGTVIEPRYVEDIACGAIDDGLTVAMK